MSEARSGAWSGFSCGGAALDCGQEGKQRVTPHYMQHKRMKCQNDLMVNPDLFSPPIARWWLRNSSGNRLRKLAIFEMLTLDYNSSECLALPSSANVGRHNIFPVPGVWRCLEEVAWPRINYDRYLDFWATKERPFSLLMQSQYRAEEDLNLGLRSCHR